MIVGQLIAVNNGSVTFFDTLAISKDRGKTWKKLNINAVINPGQNVPIMKYGEKIYFGNTAKGLLYDLDLETGAVKAIFEEFRYNNADATFQYGGIIGNCHVNHNAEFAYIACPGGQVTNLSQQSQAYYIPEMFNWRDSLFIGLDAGAKSVHLLTEPGKTPGQIATINRFGYGRGNSFAFQYDTLYSATFAGPNLVKFHLPTKTVSSEIAFADSNAYQIGASSEIVAAYDLFARKLYYRPIKGGQWQTRNAVTAFTGNAESAYYIQESTNPQGLQLYGLDKNGSTPLLGNLGNTLRYGLFANDANVMLSVLDSGLQKVDHFIYLSTDNGKTFRSISLKPLGYQIVGQAVYKNGYLFITGTTGIFAYNEATDTWAAYNNDLPGFPTCMGVLGNYLFAGFGEKGLYKYELGPIYAARGRVFLDVNNNNAFDTGDEVLPDVGVRSSKGKGVFYSQSNGLYVSATEFVQDTHRVQNNNPKISITPTFVLTNGADIQQDFAMQVQDNARDLATALSNSDVFRPGFETNLRLFVENKLLRQDNNLVEVKYDPVLVRYQSSTSAPAVVDSLAGLLRWNFATFDPFTSRTIDLVFKTKISTALGSSITVSATAQGSQPDANLSDNTATLLATVVGSYDPNDKLVSHKKLLIQNPPIKEYLNYTIRFQNTGTFDADFVNLFDTLPANLLDVNTLEILGASHAYTARMLNSNVLKVTFDAIKLVPQSVSEELSQGYFSFRIRTKNTLSAIGEIRNRAGIYFDFNPVILTPDAITQIDFPSSVKKLLPDNAIHLSPNPAKDVLQVSRAENWQHEPLNVSVFTPDGRLWSSQVLGTQEQFIPLGHYPSGMLILRIETQDGVWLSRFVKE